MSREVLTRRRLILGGAAVGLATLGLVLGRGSESPNSPGQSSEDARKDLPGETAKAFMQASFEYARAFGDNEQSKKAWENIFDNFLDPAIRDDFFNGYSLPTNIQVVGSCLYNVEIKDVSTRQISENHAVSTVQFNRKCGLTMSGKPVEIDKVTISMRKAVEKYVVTSLKYE